jgi:hypothetical protein
MDIGGLTRALADAIDALGALPDEARTPCAATCIDDLGIV